MRSQVPKERTEVSDRGTCKRWIRCKLGAWVSRSLVVYAVKAALGIGVIGCLGIGGTCSADDAPELTATASQAIDKGLSFLLSAQRDDGSWAPGEADEYAIAVTSLSLMAFMSRAEFPGSGPNGKALTRAKNWLLKKAKEAPDGFLGTTMYEHGLATMALTELWGMTREKEDDAVIQAAIEAAVDVILRSQTPKGGWRYHPTPAKGEDTSVTVTVFVGLASAQQAGFYVPNETIAKVITYFKSAVSQKTGGFHYYVGEVARDDSIACTGGGAYAAQLAGARGSKMVLDALRSLTERSPGVFKMQMEHFYYGHYYAIHAMVQAGDKYYAEWYPQIRDALIARQLRNGSWPISPITNRGRKEGGIKSAGYETPMAIIILATPHHYIPIYQR